MQVPPTLTDPRPAAAFTSDAARSLLPVGSLRASRGTVRGARRQTRQLAAPALHSREPLRHSPVRLAPTRSAPVPFRVQQQARLPTKSFVRSQKEGCKCRWQPPLRETDGIRFTALREPSGDDARCSPMRLASARLGLRCHQTLSRSHCWTALGADVCGTAPLALPPPRRGGSSFLRDPRRRQ